MSSYPLEAFRRLTQAFDPLFRSSQVGPAHLGSYYVPEAHEEFREQLRTSLLLNERGKFLIAGQPGCGKTTLLMTIAEHLREEGRLVAFVDLESMTAVQDLGLAELHLAATAELLREVATQSISLSSESLDACMKWLDEVEGSGKSSPVGPTEVAKSLTNLLKAARERPELRQMIRGLVLRKIDCDPHTLLSTLLEDFQARQPVVILDGLDKLPPDQARAFFITAKFKPMVAAPGSAVLTIPLSIVYEPDFNHLGESYNNSDNAVLPSVRLFDFNDEKHEVKDSPKGFQILRKLVKVRVTPAGDDLLTDDALDRAIVSSCGNLRELGRVVQASIVKAAVTQSPRIELYHVEMAIADQRESFRRAYQPRFLPVLQKVRDQFQLDNIDEVGKLLLYGLWVMEFRNNQAWYYLPEPVKQLLRQKEKNSGGQQ